MSRFLSVAEPSIIPARSNVNAVPAARQAGSPEQAHGNPEPERPRLTFTGIIGTICMFPMRAIIETSVALRIHPNVLTLIGVVINAGAALALASRRFLLAGVVMIAANIFDFIDGKVAHRLQLQSQFGAFWDSTLD